VFEYGDFKLASMGDLEADGIELLLERNAVVDALRSTDVLLAPHHGRQSSYSRKLLDLIEPDIVGISDSGGTENSATSRYGTDASGQVVKRRDGGDQTRYSITTRKDGVLYFGADLDGTYKVIVD
jgi:competence protein ComEC